MAASPAHRWLGIAAVAVIAAAILGWRSLGGTETRTPGVAGPIPNPQLAELMPFSKPLSDTVGVHDEAAGDVELRRDPFVKASLPHIAEEDTVVEASPEPTPAKPAESEWNVSATLTGGTRRAAIINDELLYVGDSLPGGARLTSVERDRVVLTDSKGIAHMVPVKAGEGGD